MNVDGKKEVEKTLFDVLIEKLKESNKDFIKFLQKTN